MRPRLHPNGTLLSALLALAIGLLVGQAAVGAHNQELERIAVLLIIYGSVISWLHVRPLTRTWWARSVRTIHSWRSDLSHKK